MKSINWDESYNIGVEKLDSQHKKLIEILNELEQMKKEKDMKRLTELFQELVCYSRIHFSDEEELMRNLKYPDYDFHIKEHKFFIDKLEELSSEIYEKNVYISLSMKIFLKEWLINHILSTDKKITEYI